ncbi:hypothetical protein LXL04_007981 [Taraxacum kok-saghyz]
MSTGRARGFKNTKNPGSALHGSCRTKHDENGSCSRKIKYKNSTLVVHGSCKSCTGRAILGKPCTGRAQATEGKLGEIEEGLTLLFHIIKPQHRNSKKKFPQKLPTRQKLTKFDQTVLES